MVNDQFPELQTDQKGSPDYSCNYGVLYGECKRCTKLIETIYKRNLRLWNCTPVRPGTAGMVLNASSETRDDGMSLTEIDLKRGPMLRDGPPYMQDPEGSG